MKYLALIYAFFFVSKLVYCQKLHLGAYGGLSNYQGDLLDKFYVPEQTNGVIGITLHYELSDKLMIRSGFNYAKVNGADRYNIDSSLIARNLNFETSITELSLVGEYYLFNLYSKRLSPYAFAGIAIYHFNPYTRDQNRQQVYLKPLSTEGQGLPGYPDKKPYPLTQFAIPFGGGFKFALTDDIRVGLETGVRKLFTDYLDDVSTSYADQSDLLAARGQQAVDFAYRGDEVSHGNPSYPAKGTQRGGAKYKDMYYFTGLTVSFRLGTGRAGVFGNRRGNGCPANPL